MLFSPVLIFILIPKFLATSSSSCLEFKLSSVYTSGMVLQSDSHTRGANVWGWGCAGARVAISEAGGQGGHKPVMAEVSDRGQWSAELMLAPGGPYSLTITHEARDGDKSVVTLTDVLAGDVWICTGSDDMALPMASVNDSAREITKSLNIKGVRYTELRPTPAAEEQEELIGGLRYPWTGPSRETLTGFSATCWMFARAMTLQLSGTPVGVIGAYVNGSDLRSWAPEETRAIKMKKREDKDLFQHKESSPTVKQFNLVPSSSYWNGMVSPLMNLTVTGVVMSEGENDKEMNISEYSRLLDRTITSWIQKQKLYQFGLIGLGSNIMGSADNSSWAALRLNQFESIHPANGLWIPGTVFIPSHDLADPGHRISRHKLEVANRLMNMTKYQQPPVIQKACYVYIYITLRMTEIVTENSSHKNNGFSSCCMTNKDKNLTCAMNGPNGDISILTSTNNGYLFAQECKTNSGEQGVVTEIYQSWAGGYPLLSAPLYGAVSGLPAATSWARVVTDNTDPMCVH